MPREPTSLDTPRDTTKTRELYLQQASDKKKTLCQIMPTMMPTEKVLFGVDLLFNDEGEHVITKVWDGSPAAQAEIKVGSVLKKVEGSTISGLDLEEVCELTRHFQGNRNLPLLPRFDALLLLHMIFFFLPHTCRHQDARDDSCTQRARQGQTGGAHRLVP